MSCGYSFVATVPTNHRITILKLLYIDCPVKIRNLLRIEFNGNFDFEIYEISLTISELLKHNEDDFIIIIKYIENIDTFESTIKSWVSLKNCHGILLLPDSMMSNDTLSPILYGDNSVRHNNLDVRFVPWKRGDMLKFCRQIIDYRINI